VPKDVSEDLSHSDTRLSVQLNGFEMHIYNRSHLYQVTYEQYCSWMEPFDGCFNAGDFVEK
jgi:hypothetical protein